SLSRRASDSIAKRGSARMKNTEVFPTVTNRDSMWRLMETLFPRYRALCGQDFRDSLKVINDVLPLKSTNLPSGSVINGWQVPKEFNVRAAWIKDSRGRKVIDFADHPYHLKIYSQPFSGTVDRDSLLSKIAVSEERPDAIPLRQFYYVNDWGF